MAKKSFKEDIQGADKLFSANDKTEPEKPDINIDSNILTNTLANTKTNILDNILANIREEPKGKNHTFYLSNDVANAVAEAAKKNKISSSKLVNSILKRVLVDGG